MKKYSDNMSLSFSTPTYSNPETVLYILFSFKNTFISSTATHAVGQLKIKNPRAECDDNAVLHLSITEGSKLLIYQLL